jgi:hypothetical protein
MNVAAVLSIVIASLTNQVDVGCPTCKNFAQDNRNNPPYPGTGQGSREPPVGAG